MVWSRDVRRSEGERHEAAILPYLPISSLERQVDSMDDIFGKGSRDEIFSPLNGLFLHKDIEKSLDYGFIAIIPDTELEPRNPLQPLDNLAKRQQHIKDWESQPVKDYKVAVIDAKRKEVSSRKVLNHGEMIPLSALHKRKLVFKNDFRPRARPWWTETTCRRKAGREQILAVE